MKKSMIVSGSIATVSLISGIVLKYMHAPGASFLLTLGMLIAALVFVPFLYTVWVEEKQDTADKLTLAVGMLAWITEIMGTLFKIQHWPGATRLFYATPAILLLVYVPLYFFTGTRKTDKVTGTIAWSLLVLIGCTLFFSLTVTPQSGRIASVHTTRAYLRSEQMLSAELALAAKGAAPSAIATAIYTSCDTLKMLILQRETGYDRLGADFDSKNALITDDHAIYADDIASNAMGIQMGKLKTLLAQYNQSAGSSRSIAADITDIESSGYGRYKVSEALNDLVYIQMKVLQGR